MTGQALFPTAFVRSALLDPAIALRLNARMPLRWVILRSPWAPTGETVKKAEWPIKSDFVILPPVRALLEPRTPHLGPTAIRAAPKDREPDVGPHPQ